MGATDRPRTPPAHVKKKRMRQNWVANTLAGLATTENGDWVQAHLLGSKSQKQVEMVRAGCAGKAGRR